MLLQRQVRSGIDSAVDLTPMVDVVFQLLIFLLITYQSNAEAEVELPEAVHGMGVEETSATILTLVPADELDGPVLVYAGMLPEPDALLDGREAIQEVVSEGLRIGRRRVVLQADGEVPHGEVIRISSIVAGVEGIVLHLGVKNPEE